MRKKKLLLLKLYDGFKQWSPPIILMLLGLIIANQTFGQTAIDAEHNSMRTGDIIKIYTYDRADRLQTITHKLDGGSERTIIQNTYNSLGQLSNQKNGNRTTYYSYDIHSWLTRISTQNNYGQFEEKLAYADSEKPCYNGNISSMSWKASNSTQRNYDFVYNSDSRLLSAQYSEGSQRNSNKNNFSTQYEYDCMGNIMSIKRNGLQDGGTYGKIDDLTLNYDGNQLMSVRDAVTDPTYNNVWNFTDGANQSVGNEYEYDKNGNVIKDLNRGISRMQYNTLNLPYEIQYSDGKIVKYTYSADGHKLSAEYITTMPATSKMIHYCGNLIIEDGKPKHLSFEGGYIPLDDWSMTYRYYVKDHLGNNRMVVHEAGMIEQVNNYYPFGGLMSNCSGWNAQRFKYNGKEFDRMNGLDWYDYGARWQDPATGRWHSIDPLCEKYYNVSPYVYCHNNPVMLMDSDGRDDYYDEHGIYLGTNQAETDNIYISPEDEFSKLADGRYVVGLNSRIALNDADLKAEAYSKIFTNSLKLAGFNTDNLVDGKIQVTVWDFEGGSKITENYTDKANDVGDALATTDREHSRGALITAYVWPKGTGEREIYSTRSNVVNELRDHEYNGHYVMGYSHDKGTPDPVYLMQKNSSSWNKTTTQFKEYTNKVIKQNGW